MLDQKDLVAEGKTKRIYKTEDSGIGIFQSKDDLTAGDGAKHDILLGKAVLANNTTSNVFRFLRSCGLPVSFIEQIDETSFLGELCEMIPYEVVVRRKAYGSYLTGYPYLSKGHVFPKLVVQLFLKTSGRKWGELDLPVDDPLMIISEDGKSASLYNPKQPIDGQTPFAVLDDYPLKNLPNEIEKMKEIAIRAFLALEKAWQILGKEIIDYKVEFGFNLKKELRLADVIDADSWRVLDNDGGHLSKQGYREGQTLEKVKGKYELVAELTSRFSLPKQQIILWRGSESDDFTVFAEAITRSGCLNSVNLKMVTYSLHKQPVIACNELTKLVQNCPESIIISYIGRSNGAGPTLSTQISVPVITVPATLAELSDDVWSSLRAPSQTPVMTILEPTNAVLAALQILAITNPAIYMQIRFIQEKRLSNSLILS